jgi:hypothetical protein
MPRRDASAAPSRGTLRHACNRTVLPNIVLCLFNRFAASPEASNFTNLEVLRKPTSKVPVVCNLTLSLGSEPKADYGSHCTGYYIDQNNYNLNNINIHY